MLTMAVTAIMTVVIIEETVLRKQLVLFSSLIARGIEPRNAILIEKAEHP